MRLKPVQQWISSHNVFDWMMLVLVLVIYCLELLDARRLGEAGWAPSGVLLFLIPVAVSNVARHVIRPD
jgi:hypothetical protein